MTGLTLADLTSYERKHNEANGEQNRDGHNENLSWNNGAEGDSADAAIVEARRRDRRAMLATLFASRGSIMLTAGDEFGRTQHGNNNAYAQDNAVTWLDWQRARPRARGACPGTCRLPRGLACQGQGRCPLSRRQAAAARRVDGRRMAFRERPSARRARMAAARSPPPDHAAGRARRRRADRHHRQWRPPRRSLQRAGAHRLRLGAGGGNRARRQATARPWRAVDRRAVGGLPPGAAVGGRERETAA